VHSGVDGKHSKEDMGKGLTLTSLFNGFGLDAFVSSNGETTSISNIGFNGKSVICALGAVEDVEIGIEGLSTCKEEENGRSGSGGCGKMHLEGFGVDLV